MDTILIIIGLLVLGIGATVYFIKKGKIKDSDRNLIPDVVEEKVIAVKKTAKKVKHRAKRIKEEVGDVVEQAKDIKDAIKGKPRRGRKSYKNKKNIKK